MTSNSTHLLNISNLLVNDSHNYYGGAIGNIAYNQFASLANRPGISIESLIGGTDLEKSLATNLQFANIDSYFKRRSWVSSRVDDADIVTHMYFFEPTYNALAREIPKTETPFLIGMCEAPHPRYEDEVDGIKASPFIRRLGKQCLMPLFRYTLQCSDRVVAVDENAKSYYSQYVPEEQISVIPYGVDMSRFTRKEPTSTNKILMVSRLIRRRGIQFMVKALPQIREVVPTVELHLVGDGHRKSSLEEMARDLDVRDSIVFHGNVDADRLVELYADCSVFAHLSEADGWNQPALEAMASQRPTVVTDRPHNSMVVDGETGFKVPWGDPESVAEAVLELLTDTSLAQEMGTRARNRVEEHYDWDVIAREYHELIESTIAEAQ